VREQVVLADAPGPQPVMPCLAIRCSACPDLRGEGDVGDRIVPARAENHADNHRLPLDLGLNHRRSLSGARELFLNLNRTAVEPRFDDNPMPTANIGKRIFDGGPRSCPTSVVLWLAVRNLSANHYVLILGDQQEARKQCRERAAQLRAMKSRFHSADYYRFFPEISGQDSAKWFGNAPPKAGGFRKHRSILKPLPAICLRHEGGLNGKRSLRMETRRACSCTSVR